MLFLVASFFIAIAGFADPTGLGSPARLPNQVYVPEGPACTSGRKFREVSPPKKHTKESSTLYPTTAYHDSKGIFYEENGEYYPVQLGFPLLEDHGFIIGRPKNGMVAPIFNANRKYVLADEDSYNLQYVLTKEDVQKHYLFQRIPPHYHLVNLPEPHKPEKNDLPHEPHDTQVKEQSPARSKKAGKRSDTKIRGFEFQAIPL